MMGLVAVDGVLRQGACTPGVHTAHAVHIEVDVQIDKAASLNLVGVLGAFKVFLAIVPSTDAEGLATLHAEGVFSVGDVEPAHIRSTTIVLRMDIFGFEIT